MKKRIVFLLLVIFAFVQLSAYDLQAKGVKGGINFATWSGDNLDDIESRIGLIIGGFMTYKVNDQFCIQPEVYFTMKGAQSEWEYEDEEYDEYEKDEMKWKLNYLEVPLLGVMNIPVESSLAPKLFFGPAIGINLSATYEDDWEYTYDGDTDSGSSNGDMEKVNALELGLVVGGSVNIEKLIIDLRYDIGLTDIGDWENSIKNRVFSILVGMQF